MGQKIHPQGYRTGVSRKWDNTWYALGLQWKKIFFYQKELEYYFHFFFQRYTYTKISRRTKVLLFDIKLFKYILSKFFVFVLFYRLRTHRRKETRAILRKPKVKLTGFKKYIQKQKEKAKKKLNKHLRVRKQILAWKKTKSIQTSRSIGNKSYNTSFNNRYNKRSNNRFNKRFNNNNKNNNNNPNIFFT